MSTIDTKLEIVKLEQETACYIDNFDCGNHLINNYLREEAIEFCVAKTYLFVSSERSKLIGFFSLCADNMIESLMIDGQENLTFAGSSIRIHMFAIDKEFQGKKDLFLNNKEITYAHFLLSFCIELIQNLVKDNLGASFITLFSTKQGIGLYKNIGDFEELDSDYRMIPDAQNNDCIPMYRSLFPLD